MLKRLLVRWFENRIEKAAAAADIRPTDPLLTELTPGKPAVVYFGASWCGPCKTVQEPALKQLETMLDVQVIRVDVEADPATAKRWGVTSLPRTFILDGEGRTRLTNLDVVHAPVLHEQITTAQHSPPDDGMQINKPDTNADPSDYKLGFK